MYLYIVQGKAYIRYSLTLLIILILLTACGGSNNNNSDEGEPTTSVPSNPDTGDSNHSQDDESDPPTNDPSNPDTADSNDSQNQDPSILKVSDVHTAGTPDSPIIVFNKAGDGVSVWSVRSDGTWLYYSLYDHASDSWSQAKQLTAVTHDDWQNAPQVVSNGTGYAVSWMANGILSASLFNHGEWTTSLIDRDAVSSENYQLATNGTGYLLAWIRGIESGNITYTSISQDGTAWGDATSLAEANSDNPHHIQIATYDSSYALIWQEGLIWEQLYYRTFGNIYDGTAWQGTEELVSESLFLSRIASNGSGYSLVWSAAESIMNKIYTESDGWSQAHELFHDSSSSVYDIVSNGTGYCTIFTASGPSDDTALYAAIDALGDANWGEASRLTLPGQQASQKTLVSDGISYAVAWGQYGSNNDSGNIIQHYASVYRDTTWDTVSEPFSIVPITPERLGGNTPFNGLPVEIAGLNGQYIVALKQLIDGEESISAARYDSIEGWQNAEALESDSGTASDPIIAVDSQRGLSVIWHQTNDTETGLATYGNRWDGDQWSGKRLLSEAGYLLGSSHNPHIIAADNGQTLAVWTQDRNGYQALFANIRNGDNWGQPVVLSDSITETAPQVSSNGSGFALSWEEKSDDIYTLKGLAFEQDEWSESIVNDIAVLHQSSFPIPIAMTSNGSSYMLLYIHYTILTHPGVSLLARHFDGAAWSEPATMTESAYSYSGYPQIATNGSTYMTAWLQVASTPSLSYDTLNLYSSEFDGESWGATQFVAYLLEDMYSTNLLQGRPDIPQESLELPTGFPDVPQLASNGTGYGLFWFDLGNVISSLYTDQWSQPEDIGDVNLHSWDEGETPSVASNGRGYAVAWRNDSASAPLNIFANVYDGAAWGGAQNLSGSSHVLFDIFDNNRLIKASGEKYMLLWGEADEEYRDDAGAIYARVFDATEWSSVTQLNHGGRRISQFQLASDGTGFLAAWLQDDSENGNSKIIKSVFNDNQWTDPEIVDESGFNQSDLDLQGGDSGYQAIWTREEQGGEPWVRIPWAKTGL